VTAIAVAPDSRHVVFGSANGALKVYDLQTRQIVKELQAGLHIEEEEREQVVGLPTETVRIVSTERNLQPLQNYKEWVTCVAVTSEGRYAISSSRNHFLKFWDLQTGENVATIRLEAELKCVSFTQEATLLLTGDNVGNVDCLRYVNVQ
jgi:WD40 repeat protein